jgi:hypothetical protein
VTPAASAGEREAMRRATETEMERLRRFYRTNSAIRTELAYLRMRWPLLESEEQRQANERERGALSLLLLEVSQ